MSDATVQGGPADSGVAGSGVAGGGPAGGGGVAGEGGPAAESGRRLTTRAGIDTEELTGRTFPYQFDRSLVEDVDLVEATPGADINWLEDIHLMYEDGIPAVFDRYTNAFLKIYFEIPEGEGDTYARKVLITHLREGNSYGIWLKRKHAKFTQPELGSWRADSPTVGDNWQPPVLADWQPPEGH